MDRPFRLLPRAKWARFVVAALALLIASLVALYMCLLGMQAYSARQASIALSRLETLKLGDPAASYDQAVSGLRNEAGVHILTAGAFWFPELWDCAWKLPERSALELMHLSSRAGLRWWRLTTSASTQDGKIGGVFVRLMVAGRYETLGAAWALEPHIPSLYEQWPLSLDERRTYVGWFSITSWPSGEGFHINATGQSTGKELLARRINGKCLFSFRGCDGLCELLPDAVPVLQDRRRGWGGGTGAPRSACDPK